MWAERCRLPGTLFHGTASAYRIALEGLRPSEAGGGQLCLRGAWLTPCFDTALRYAESAARWSEEGGTSAVLEIQVPALRVLDLRAVRGGVAAIWGLLGFDLRQDAAARAEVRRRQRSDTFAVSAALLAAGYGAAWIRSTLYSDPAAAPELVVFEPSVLAIRQVYNPEPAVA